MTHNEFMISFLQAYLDFAKNPENSSYTMYKDVGLCTNMIYYGSAFDIKEATFVKLEQMFIDQFNKSNFANPDYPFGKTDYYKRMNDNTQHECPKRLAFVKQYLKELQNQ